ncbi:TPA: ATP-dependent Clp protease adaptor ClpS [Campylobacter lari]|uniref:ATP-dependent Clp protease adaptor ClpS n=1 Tax=Campylobacter lari TaxID=201 RepID=UPI001271F697|nr:ATP-dependent Clp protease adaptor ClpS [Campylobacter lari]EAI7268919.1 ATP-dependent Clp protease adaptor ClpS [Campylobacter lari]EAK9947279.1 ATP-dependent Clp protease adaptor ClpS [Campylobacter lari]EDP6894334.1 ATP-dependent Clp protease adaptor ClpS [Campylobacter lari]MCV3367531.1 ATP-dependent Clp protease adaptor ClpS [Campylobacter lari]MCW0187248.1 ATP-dependent Clp protease adaptor ClpS [Campylobacter lari]
MSLKSEILEQQKLAEPKMFKVLLLNDDITTMEFVIEVLMNIFHHDFEKASAIMLEIHNQGSGICGIYTEEIALSKKQQVDLAAKSNNFPLQTRIEEQ